MGAVLIGLFFMANSHMRGPFCSTDRLKLPVLPITVSVGVVMKAKGGADFAFLERGALQTPGGAMYSNLV